MLVVVLEDDPGTARLFEELLALDGHRAEVVDTLAEARAAVRRGGALVVVGTLPDSSARLHPADALDLRHLATEAPVLLCLDAEWAYGADAAALGVVGVVPKPFGLTRFRDAVAQGLRQAATAQRRPA
jgi:DNA-binding NtrC family response regulator